MKVSRKRWNCPKGEHPGVLAPGRLRKIDVRRYCLECSVVTGVLVERVCRANEKKVEASKKKSARKAKSKRASVARTREQAQARQRAREVVNGINIAREVDRVWAYALRLGGARMRRTRVPRLTVSLSRYGTSGRAWTSGRIHLSLGLSSKRARIVGVIAHEVAHHMAWGEGHSERFWSCLAELVEHAYGTQPAQSLDGNRYAKQRAIENGIEEGCAWLHGPEYNPPRKPAAPGAGRARVESVRA